MVCILTEKPSAARNFAKALGGVKGNFNGESYEIVSARGHLVEFKKPAEQVPPEKAERYGKWDLDNLPWDHRDMGWKYAIKNGTGECLRQIKAACLRGDEIVIATDDDPTGEGSLLAWEILAHLGLDGSGKRITRMFFGDEAPASIQKAFQSRKGFAGRFSDPDYNKALFRSQFDFLTMQFTRVATVLGDGRSVLRQGRLKSAMVRLVGDQLSLVSDYKKIPFYQNRFWDDNGHVYTNKEEPMFADKGQVPMVYKNSSVTMDQQEARHTSPPKLLDLAALSARLASKGYKAKDVMAVYQKMYEEQVVSYPRTEDKHVTGEQFKELLPLLPKIAGVAGVDVKLLTHKTMRKTHVKEGCAHGANRPGLNVPSSLDELSRKYGPVAPEIYRLLARNYLAMLAEDYAYVSQSGHVTDYPGFSGTAQIPKVLGWKQVYTSDDDDDSSLSGLGSSAAPFIFEGFPPKPAYPTFKWLVKQLEKHDVGTGATRTSTYAEVTSESVKYPLMTDKRGKLGMTPYGEMSYVLLKDTCIGDVAVTEQLQQDMRDVADKKAEADVLLAKVAEMVLSDKQIMKRNSLALREKGVKMEQTGIKEKQTGTFNGREVSFNKEWGGHVFTDAEVARLLGGETISFEMAGNSGTYTVRGKFGPGTYKGKQYWGFQKEDGPKDMSGRVACKFKGKDISFKKAWGSHAFTDEEIAGLIAGDDIAFEAEGKNGPYLVTGKLGQGEYKGRKYWGFIKN